MLTGKLLRASVVVCVMLGAAAYAADEPKPKAPKADPHPKDLVAKWVGEQTTPGGMVRFGINLKADGRYVLTADGKLGRLLTQQGDWKVIEDSLIFDPDEGKKEEHEIVRRDEDTLVIRNAYGKLTLNKQ